jgi:hypothetical protein
VACVHLVEVKQPQAERLADSQARAIAEPKREIHRAGQRGHESV